MGKYEPKTSGVDWLYYSLVAFNGNRKYADRSTVLNFLESYLKYKQKKQDFNACQLVEDNFAQAKKWSQDLLKGELQSLKPHAPKLSVKQAVTAQPQWIPREFYIPEYANPRSKFKRQATNIAKQMRDKLDAEENKNL